MEKTHPSKFKDHHSPVDNFPITLQIYCLTEVLPFRFQTTFKNVVRKYDQKNHIHLHKKSVLSFPSYICYMICIILHKLAKSSHLSATFIITPQPPVSPQGQHYLPTEYKQTARNFMEWGSNISIKALSFFNVLKRKFLPKKISNLEQGVGM